MRRYNRRSHARYSDGDVEGEVGRVGVRGRGGAKDTEANTRRAAGIALGSGDGRGGNQLDLTEEANIATYCEGGTNGLAHVTEHQTTRRRRSRRGSNNRIVERSDVRRHGASGVVARSRRASGRHKLIRGGGRRSNDSGGRVVRGVRLNLADETSNG